MRADSYMHVLTRVPLPQAESPLGQVRRALFCQTPPPTPAGESGTALTRALALRPVDHVSAPPAAPPHVAAPPDPRGPPPRSALAVVPPGPPPRAPVPAMARSARPVTAHWLAGRRPPAAPPVVPRRQPGVVRPGTVQRHVRRYLHGSPTRFAPPRVARLPVLLFSRPVLNPTAARTAPLFAWQGGAPRPALAATSVDRSQAIEPSHLAAVAAVLASMNMALECDPDGAFKELGKGARGCFALVGSHRPRA